MNVLFIGKRFYTNRDALREKYGRIYQLPRHWTGLGIATRLWLIDYHTRKSVLVRDGKLDALSTPVRNLAIVQAYRAELRRTPKPDMIVASGDCYIGLMGYRLSKRLQARFVFDIYDKYDEFGAYLRLPVFNLFRFLRQHADTCLFASRALLEQLSHDCREAWLVPNGLDTQRFRPLDKQSSRETLGLPRNATLIGYFGGMTPDRGVDDLIEAIRRLQSQGQNIELVLGGTSRRDMNLAGPGLHYLGNIPYELMPKALASCDLLAVPYRRSAFMDAGASNKIAEAIACDRALVATRTPNFVANFPTQAAALGTLLADPGNSDDLARAISEQCKQHVLVKMPPGFDWQEIAATLAEELGLSDGMSNPAAQTA